MVKGAKTVSDIRLNHIACQSIDRLQDFADRLMAVSLRPEAIGTVKESRLIHCNKDLIESTLHNLILEAGYPQRTLLIRSRLGNINPPAGAGKVCPSL